MSGRPSSSPYWALLAPAAALAAVLARWQIQGSGNIYTVANKRFYVPDPVLGWRIHPDGPPWLGLDAAAGVAALLCALMAGSWMVRRREAARGTAWTGARAGLWLLGAAPLILPLWAFAGGLGPVDGREQFPVGDGGVLDLQPGGIDGHLAGASAGRYHILPGSGSAVTARVSAGGETFEARFTDNLDGFLVVDPADLRKPVEATVRVDSASVDTGVRARSKHAREGYLRTDEHPEIRLALGELVAARQGASQSEIAFWASSTVELLGTRLSLPVKGTVRVLDQAAREAIGASGPALLVSAQLELVIADSPLAGDAGDFDADTIPIHASLVLGLAAANAMPVEGASTPHEQHKDDER